MHAISLGESLIALALVPKNTNRQVIGEANVDDSGLAGHDVHKKFVFAHADRNRANSRPGFTGAENSILSSRTPPAALLTAHREVRDLLRPDSHFHRRIHLQPRTADPSLRVESP